MTPTLATQRDLLLKGTYGRLRAATQGGRRLEECRKLGLGSVLAPIGTKGAALEADTLRRALALALEKPA